VGGGVVIFEVGCEGKGGQGRPRREEKTPWQIALMISVRYRCM